MPQETKVFLLDETPSGPLGINLQEVLASSACSGIQLCKESIDALNFAGFRGLSDSLCRFDPDVLMLILSSLCQRDIKGLIQTLKTELLTLPIMAVIEGDNPDRMVEILKLGVSDFITPPFKSIDILPRLWRLSEHKQPLMQRLKERLGLKQLVGNSPVFHAEAKKIPLVARCDASTLISGETGTGKELCARAIHYMGQRAGMPFITVNCGAIPVELLENELFGHIHGAFTGARYDKSGLINEANGGTLFLDEIDCLPLLAQVKLLRFLQEKEFRQLGSTKVRQADVRIIAATNIRLEEAVAGGMFRQDLFYRLNIIPITMPPLRERMEDIPLLAYHFLAKYSCHMNSPIMDIAPDAMDTLLTYDWPGNVRELENVIERAVVFSRQAVIQAQDIILPHSAPPLCGGSFKTAKAQAVEEFEKNYIKRLLLVHQGNISKAAKAAGKNRRSFWELIRRYNIDAQPFRKGKHVESQPEDGLEDQLNNH